MGACGSPPGIQGLLVSAGNSGFVLGVYTGHAGVSTEDITGD